MIETTSTTVSRPQWWNEEVWGSDRFFSEGDVAEGQYAFVIDSGVALLDDLNVNTEWSKSFVPGEPDPHGTINEHGTAVASVIGAKANGIGITGIAPGAQIVALKALGNDGGGNTEILAEAISYAKDLILEHDLADRAVVNLSLGGASPDRSPGILELANAGIKVTISAGNEGFDVDGFSPASYGHHPNVYTVSSYTKGGEYAYFTNYDGVDLNNEDDVDFAAPGLGINSYNALGEISQFSGTSLSAPMVAGILLMSEEVRPGELLSLTDDQVAKGMIPDPKAMFDPYTYKHGEKSGTPAPAVPAGSIPPKIGEVIEVSKTITGLLDAPNRLKGTDLDELITGGALRDRLNGGSGDDFLFGYGGGDRITGGTGDDVIISGGGKARLKGGEGADVFVLGVDAGRARIIDFDASEDRLYFPGDISVTHKGGKTKVRGDGDLLAVMSGHHEPDVI